MSNVKNKKEVIRFVIIRTVGNFLVLFSIYGIAMTLGPAAYLEAVYRFNSFRNVRYELAYNQVKAEPVQVKEEITPTPTVFASPTPMVIANSTFFGQIAGGDKIEFITPVSSRFGLVIPKIGANAPIIANVNAADSKAYLPALKKGVAHALGTVFPGVIGNIFLFAHSTDNFWNVGRYNAIFYLIKELENGDEVNLIYQGRRYKYRVTDKLVVNPTETEFLTKQTNYEQLTLQTCWPPGTTFKRLIIIARPEKDLALRD